MQPWEQLLPPLAAAGASLVLGPLLAARAPLPRWAAGMPAAAMLAAAGAGVLMLLGWHDPARQMDELLPGLLLIAAPVVAVLGALRGQAGPLEVALTVFVIAGAGCQIMAERPQAPPLPPIVLAAGIGGLCAVIAMAAELGMAAVGPIMARLLLGIVLGGAAATLAGSGAANAGIAAGCITAAATAPIVYALWRSPSSGVIGLAIAGLSWCFVTVGLTAVLPRASSLVLIPAACALGLAAASGNLMRVKALQRHPRLARVLVIATAVVLVGAGIAWIALVGQPDRSPADEGMY
jgi:hypothetical protein